MALTYFNSPIGLIEITETEGFISSILFVEEEIKEATENEILMVAKNELQLYFGGNLKTFSFLMKQDGTNFQQQVWENLKSIPLGHQISYTTLAIKLKNLAAIRAVAATNGKNKILIAIPCHRVIGMRGDMTGYAGGIWRKKWLLNHEAVMAQIGQKTLDF